MPGLRPFRTAYHLGLFRFDIVFNIVDIRNNYGNKLMKLLGILPATYAHPRFEDLKEKDIITL
jgi:hypothetical protein